MRDDLTLLLDMLIAAQKIQRFVQEMDLAEFTADDMVQSAVIREFQVIGEAARMISDTTKDQHTSIDWPNIAGMRNRLVHEYFAIRLEVVWKTIREDVPPLITYLTPLIPKDEDEA
jgi:uncharacterized protein with HEPN domain